MNLSDFIKIGASIIVWLGGASAIILAVSKWFGDILANKLLEQVKQKYNTELEELKSYYERELEKYKDHLEKQKALFLMYRENQFKLYKDLWTSLADLQFKADELWQKADIDNLIAFSNQLHETGLSIERNRLLIEERHYRELHGTLNSFRAYEVGKTTLIRLRDIDPQEARSNISDDGIRAVIDGNWAEKQEYSWLLEVLAVEFRRQIAGG